MNGTSTLRGIMLDTFRTEPLPSRRLFAAFCVRGGAYEVPISELYSRVPRLAVSRPASRVPLSLIN